MTPTQQIAEALRTELLGRAEEINGDTTLREVTFTIRLQPRNGQAGRNGHGHMVVFFSKHCGREIALTEANIRR